MSKKMTTLEFSEMIMQFPKTISTVSRLVAKLTENKGKIKSSLLAKYYREILKSIKMDVTAKLDIPLSAEDIDLRDWED